MTSSNELKYFDKQDLHLRLLADIPVTITEAGRIVCPTLRDIAEMGLGIYNENLSILLIDRSMFGKDVDESISNYDLFCANCYQNEEFQTKALSSLELFFGSRPEIQFTNDAMFFSFGDTVLHRDNFPMLQEFLTFSNRIEINKEPEYNPGNDKAKKMIEMIMKNAAKKPKKKEQMDLISIASGLAWKNVGVNIKTVFDLTIYQIYDGFFLTNRIDDYRHTIQALYAGTIDPKTVKLAQIHWANKLN